MKTTRIVLIILGIIIITGQLIVIDFDDLGWKTNSGSYLSILSMLLLVFAMIYSINEAKKNQ